MMAARGKARRNANGQGGVYRRADGRWEAKVFVDTPDGRRKRISVYGDSERGALDELEKSGISSGEGYRSRQRL